jgi:hypothetical protein
MMCQFLEKVRGIIEANMTLDGLEVSGLEEHARGGDGHAYEIEHHHNG